MSFRVTARVSKLTRDLQYIIVERNDSSLTYIWGTFNLIHFTVVNIILNCHIDYCYQTDIKVDGPLVSCFSNMLQMAIQCSIIMLHNSYQALVCCCCCFVVLVTLVFNVVVVALVDATVAVVVLFQGEVMSSYVYVFCRSL